MGYVYKITNTVNGKAYIGFSIHEPEKRRIRQHLSGQGNRIIAKAVKKYGKDAFVCEVLEANVFDEFLPDLEVAYIAKHNTVAPHGYNLDSGGGGIPSEETRKKISESRKGKKHPQFGKPLSAETRRKISEALKGREHSADTRRKLSEAMKGKKHPQFGKPLSAETRRKISEALKGREHSADTRRKLSEAHKGKTRKPLSTDTRCKISEAMKGRERSAEHCRKISESKKGKNNPNFGKPPSAETRRKISEASMHPDQIPAREYFLSLPSDMPLKEKRRLLYTTFRNVDQSTIYRWVRKWTSP